MSGSSGPESQIAAPRLLFATAGLAKGTGGIAELSRKIVRTFLGMHHNKLIKLDLHVLDDEAPQAGDDLFSGNDLPSMHWYAGNRRKFALGLVAARPDVQLFDHVGLARLQGSLPRWLARPYLLLIHGIEIWNNDRPDYHRTARNADLLIANSEYTARKSRARYPDLPEIKMCWPGKDQAVNRNAPEMRPLENIGPHAMLIVGRLSAEQKHKGHDQLLEAMPAIVRAVPDAQLVIAGGGDDRERLESRAQGLGVAEHVIFTGWADEAMLQRLYAQCALFVMPSDGDGFGLVFLEAMAHRKPCVGLKGGAAAEIFEEGKSGILVDREDRQGMADRLSGLLLDETERMRLGDAAHERYQSLFTARHYTERFQSVLLDYLENKYAT